MALSPEMIDELKANVAFARKREMAFGLCIGKSPETTVLINHKTKDPETLGRQAKKDGETAKIAFGTMTCEGKNLNLSCAGDVPTGLARRTREMFKVAGLKFKIRILDAEGNSIEEDGGDEDDDVASAGATGGGAAADPQTEEWTALKQKVGTELQRLAETPLINLEAAKAAWQEAHSAADGGDLGGAISRGTKTLDLVAEATKAAELAEDDRKHWEDSVPKITSLVEEAAAQASPLLPKINAVWSFAKTKADANPPDYAAAIKSITMLVKLISDSRAMVAKAAAPAMAGAGAGGGGAGASPAGGNAVGDAAPPAAGSPAPAAAPAPATGSADWKRTLDLFHLRLVPLDRHAQAGAVPQVKPKIDAIKADMAKAVALADKQDFKGATAALEPLNQRCDDTLALADGYAHYKAILVQRQVSVAIRQGAPVGDVSIDKYQTEMEALLASAMADAALDKYDAAIKSLDKIPPIFDLQDKLASRKTAYDALITPFDAAIVNIDALPAAVLALKTADIAKLKTDYANAKIAVTNDYARSMQLLQPLTDRLNFLFNTLTAGQGYQASLAAFQPQLQTFKAHLGRPGIEEFCLAMERDLASAQTEANGGKFGTAQAILDRSQPQWAAQQKIADDCLAYTTKRDAVAAVIAGLKSKPAAASVLTQAEALMATAAKQALAKDFAGALANVTEAEKRAADAKKAAEAQDDLGKLKDGAALGDMAAAFDKAMKVFTDMRANVVAKDPGNAFAALIATADAAAQKARDEKAKPAPDFAVARKALDEGIAILEGALPKIVAKGPYDAHLAAAKALSTALVPLNIDKCIDATLTSVKSLVAEAETLAKAPGYDYPAAEAKLTEAAAAAEGAKANAALWPAIKADRATTVSAKTAISAPAGVAAMMPKRITRIDALVTDIDAKVAAGDFKAAAAAAAEGAALLAPTQADVLTCQTIQATLKAWYTNHLPQITGPANAVAAVEFAKTQTKLAAHQALLAEENFDGALNMLDEVSWGVTACHRVIAESGTYEPARVAAAAKIKAVADIRNAGVETVLVAIEKTYADAVTQATAQNFYGAERVMKEIPKQCDPLVAKAKAWKLYDDARKPAEAKLTEAEGHKAAASIQPMLTRLRAKYDAAVKQAEGGDAAGAQKAMTEILAAATNAIKTADTSAGFADDASKMGDAGPDPAMVAKAKAQLAKLTATPEAASSKPDLDEASKQLTSLDASGLDPTVAKAAFKAATDALTRAEMAQDQTRMLGANVKAAKAKIAELKAHAQAAYIAPETAKLGTEADDVQKAALAGGNPDGATANLETTMDGVAKALAMANAQAAYIKLRATPEVEPRLEVLEKHPHRYAIKANIDTIKTKLQAAADASAAKNPDAALTLLQEVRALGISSLVMADMRANKPPKVADVKAILAGPGGQAELDAMIEQMEPDAQRAVLRVAFEARFGCKLENFSGVDANGDPSGIVADMGLQGPNIKRFYEIMAELPPQDAVNNDSMRTFQNVEDGGQGSLYSGDKKKVVMREGSEVLSSSYTFGSEHEVGKVDPGCEPVDDKEVNFFSWNTMHEVGHAVDDKHSFMDKNGTGPAYGGWTTYGRNVKPVADVLAKQFAYDARYIGQYLAHATSIALPPAPTGAGAVTAEEWEKRRIAVCAWVDMAGVGNNPWASNALAGQLAIGGVVYHESYANSWSSYSLGARAQGMTGYQFRAPGEWFAELYAAFHAKKLKPAHPAYGWISAL